MTIGEVRPGNHNLSSFFTPTVQYITADNDKPDKPLVHFLLHLGSGELSLASASDVNMSFIKSSDFASCQVDVSVRFKSSSKCFLIHPSTSPVWVSSWPCPLSTDWALRLLRQQAPLYHNFHDGRLENGSFQFKVPRILQDSQKAVPEGIVEHLTARFSPSNIPSLSALLVWVFLSVSHTPFTFKPILAQIIVCKNVPKVFRSTVSNLKLF